MLKAALVERAADGADAAVHHVRGRHQIGAGLGLRHRHARQDLERGVVEDLAVLDQPVVAVGGVGIHRHVGDDEELGQRVLELAHRALEQAVGIGRLGREPVLARLGKRREERHRGHAQAQRLARLRDCEVDRKTRDSRHRRDRLARAAALDHEQRIDEVGGGELGLADQRADRRRGSIAARADRQVGSRPGQPAHRGTWRGDGGHRRSSVSKGAEGATLSVSSHSSPLGGPMTTTVEKKRSPQARHGAGRRPEQSRSARHPHRQGRRQEHRVSDRGQGPGQGNAVDGRHHRHVRRLAGAVQGHPHEPVPRSAQRARGRDRRRGAARHPGGDAHPAQRQDRALQGDVPLLHREAGARSPAREA